MPQLLAAAASILPPAAPLTAPYRSVPQIMYRLEDFGDVLVLFQNYAEEIRGVAEAVGRCCAALCTLWSLQAGWASFGWLLLSPAAARSPANRPSGRAGG
jgi:hypothetical protein